MLLTLFALLFGSVFGFLGYLNWKVSDNVDSVLVIPTTEISVPEGAIETEIPKTGVGKNILVVGSDTRDGGASGRSDVIVLIHIPEDAKKIQLIHFPRDLFVSIPGHGKNKINAAYAFGGTALLVQTLQNLLGVKIDHIAQTDFEGFKAMTDAVGGVRVYAEEASGPGGNGGPYVINQGWNDLNGEQALAFVRERYQLSEGDISRGRRQMAFIKALMTKALSKETITNPIKVAKFTDAATENLSVDKGFTTKVMREYALSLRNIRSGDVIFITAPFTGFGMDPTAGSIDIVDEPGMLALGEALRTDAMDTYEDVSVIP